MFFHPAKVLLKVFSILFRIHWACCDLELTLDPRPPVRQESRPGQNFPVCSITLYPNSREPVNSSAKTRGRREKFKIVVDFMVAGIFHKSFWTTHQN